MTDGETWTSFETAHEALETQTVDGMGFVFTEDDPLVGVDLDECRIPETATLTDDAADIVDRLASYTEVSPSGTGVHVICSGTLPGDRSRKGWVELYEEARFFTVTGDHVDGTPTTVESRSNELATVQAEYVASEPSEADATADQQAQPTESAPDSEADSTAATQSAGAEQNGSTPDNELSDTEVVERARAAANGEKFTRLWNGQTSGYESHSEADMALCALLAFWTGGERDQIDRLFRDSGLMREKWDEQHYADGSTYGEKTIERVLQGTDEFYQPTGGSPDDGSAASDSMTEESEQPTATQTSGSDEPSEGYALREQLSELQAREDHHLSVIADLQSQVQRLEAENERLADELAALREERDADPDDHSDIRTVGARLRGLLPFGST
ncbi:hypothetical protein [Halosimplex pelagicum]|uniref:phage NrS-1 polymerase family protein n=1 Tax=Halosimplex pelagicum TaxID=869886 RepID=UPI001FE2582B|nr:hypothetical protein [Halosimplex pelagicum]